MQGGNVYNCNLTFGFNIQNIFDLLEREIEVRYNTLKMASANEILELLENCFWPINK